jgi:hypothetical protein
MEGVSSRGMGGVGLRLKYEDLARWQDAILKRTVEPTPASAAQMTRRLQHNWSVARMTPLGFTAAREARMPSNASPTQVH